MISRVLHLCLFEQPAQQECLDSELIKRIDELIAEQKEMVNWMHEQCKIMSNFNFAVKNSVDMMKMM